MRLTHKVKYRDKRKNREPMLKIRNKLFELENILEEFNINDINELRTCLENEKKGTEYFEDWWNKRFEELFKPKVEALKIIKEKNVDIDYLKYCYQEFNDEIGLEQYNRVHIEFGINGKELTKEEYALLKEELVEPKKTTAIIKIKKGNLKDYERNK